MTPNPDRTIRTRLAPSPTGPLHLGTARTAIFNWLFTKKMGGTFVMRIEDTDKERSHLTHEKDIIENLQWLGIDWDEGPDIGGNFGPYRQSERQDKYSQHIKKLLEEGSAYYCFCAKEELDAQRQAMLEKGEAPRYSGACRQVTKDEARKKIAANDPYTIRFKVADEPIQFEDIIRGKVEFDGSLIGDFVVAKDENTPLYNFAVVVDDFDMQITHVIRGEDHISNTPRQILIQKALNVQSVQYAHLPLILNPDKSKMSKRKGLFNVSDYKKEGYLPEALFNFLALLGWHPEDDEEVLSQKQLVEKFSLERVQKSGAIFNENKLNWLNGEYIKKTDTKVLYNYIKPELEKRGWKSDEEYVSKIIKVERPRMKKISDFF